VENFFSWAHVTPGGSGSRAQVGLQAVRILDAMYRSAASKKTEKAL
jgi:hypothetical protein